LAMLFQFHLALGRVCVAETTDQFSGQDTHHYMTTDLTGV
jgi:hypothetical protein